MIKEIKGDIIKALKDDEIDYLIHCCNDQGIMNSGVSKRIKKEFPDAFETYIESFNDHLLFKDSPLGSFTIDSYGSGVINLVGQEQCLESSRMYCNYGAVGKGFLEVINYFPATNLFKKLNFERKIRVGIPYKFASNTAGGDWNIILQMIELMLGSFVDVYIYK